MAGLNQFVNVTEAEIAEALIPLGFVKTDLPGTGEVTFSKRITYEGVPTICRVYTAIFKAGHVRAGESRPAGQDAIRVCLGRPISTPGHVYIRIFKTLPVVRRTGTWRVHLLNRIAGIGDGLAKFGEGGAVSELDLLGGRVPASSPSSPASPPVSGQLLACPRCGARMLGPKPSRFGAFYGCSRFPVCRGGRNIDGGVRD